MQQVFAIHRPILTGFTPGTHPASLLGTDLLDALNMLEETNGTDKNAYRT